MDRVSWSEQHYEGHERSHTNGYLHKALAHGWLALGRREHIWCFNPKKIDMRGRTHLVRRSILFICKWGMPSIISFTPINPTNVLDPRWEWDKSSWRSIKSALSLFVWHCQTQLLDEKHPPVSLHLRCVFRRWWMKSKKSVQGPIQKILPRVRIKRDRSFHSLLVFVTTTMQSPIQLVTESLSRQACDHEGSFGFRRNMHWC